MGRLGAAPKGKVLFCVRVVHGGGLGHYWRAQAL